jgi:lipoate-protein ligase A
MRRSAAYKAPGGKLLRVSADLEDGLIRAPRLNGDFFAHPEEGFEAAEAALDGLPPSSAARVFAEAIQRLGVELYGFRPEDLEVALSMLESGPPLDGSSQRQGP